LAGQRRRGKPLLKKQPPLVAPLPENYSALPPLPSESPDIKDIRFVTALPFAKFFQNPDYKIFKFTWEELNNIKKKPHINQAFPRHKISTKFDRTERHASISRTYRYIDPKTKNEPEIL
jgi:hypothetical protein